MNEIKNKYMIVSIAGLVSIIIFVFFGFLLMEKYSLLSYSFWIIAVIISLMTVKYRTKYRDSLDEEKQ